MNELISVIIPAHNSSQTIKVAIESIANQTYKNIELIVVNDNSIDNTAEIVKILMEKYSNLRYHELPFDDTNRYDKKLKRNINAGYAARNFGFKKSKGDWITFQDADDASLLNRIEIQYLLAKKYNSSHVCIDCRPLKETYLNKRLDLEKFLSENTNFIINKFYITNLSKKTKGIIIPLLGKINQLIPLSFKRLRIINKFFFRSLESYPLTGGCPLLKREIMLKIKFRPLEQRVWPSFMGRGADRDFNFQVAETFNDSMGFKIPLYLWRKLNNNDNGNENLSKYLID